MNVCIVVTGDSYAYSGSYATYVRIGLIQNFSYGCIVAYEALYERQGLPHTQSHKVA